MLRTALSLATIALFAAAWVPTHAALVEVTVGANDGFGGLIAPSSPDGFAIGPAVLDPLPLLPAGSSTNQTNFKTDSALHKLTYEFPLNTLGFTSITSAELTFYAASVGVSGAFVADGFGMAVVTFDGADLGLLNSPLVGDPEVYRHFAYNVSGQVAPGFDGTKVFMVDGLALAGNDAVDGFKVDYVQLIVDGTPVIPEPSTFAIWAVVGMGLLVLNRRTSAHSHR